MGSYPAWGGIMNAVGQGKMIDWNSEDVAAFLAATPEMPNGEDTEFRFRFAVREAHAELGVFPFDGRITLTMWIGRREENLACWAFDCARISVRNEIEEEGGQFLAIEAPHEVGQLRVWLGIGRDGGGFSIHSAAEGLG